MYSGYGIAFDGASLCIFDSDFERKVVIFGVDNISSSHTDNRKVREQLMILMAVSVQQRKSLVLILVKQGQSFA